MRRAFFMLKIPNYRYFEELLLIVACELILVQVCALILTINNYEKRFTFHLFSFFFIHGF
jgi:hypothetical protein